MHRCDLRLLFLCLCTVSVDVIDLPLSPEGPLEISNVTESSAQLQWYPPRDNGGGPIIGYIIDARELGNVDVIR